MTLKKKTSKLRKEETSSLNSVIGLGPWAVIDLETTGIDPLYDSIIDVGFLQFEGTKLVKQYRSLVAVPMAPDRAQELSHFVQKLTGITPEMVKIAPRWNKVKEDVLELAGHSLIAHNAEFEKGFLSPFFEGLLKAGNIENPEEIKAHFFDSLPFLALAFVGRPTLGLESYITEFQLREHEIHRGLEDSLDLLKVMLLAGYGTWKRPIYRQQLLDWFQRAGWQDQFFVRWFNLTTEDLVSIASQIEFDVEMTWDLYLKNKKSKNELTPEQIDWGKLKRSDLSFSGNNVKEILRDETHLQEILSHYHYRASQEELALRVGQSFKNNVHALVQAPTGTGKTLGYLLPGTLFSIGEKQKVLVATGTKALQHQAMEKDIPQLRKILGLKKEDFKIVQLIGSSNHLCELMFREELEQDQLLFQSKNFEEQFAAIYFDLLFLQNSELVYSDKANRGHLPYVLKKTMPEIEEWEGKIAVDFRACTGQRCPFANDCSYLSGLREAKEANLIVGNHALMFTWPKGVPRPSKIVVDEAHKIEQEATKAYTRELGMHELRTLEKAFTTAQGLGPLFYLIGQSEDQQESNSSGESGNAVSFKSSASANEQINRLRQRAHESGRMLSDHLLNLHDLAEAIFKRLPKYTPEYWNEMDLEGKIFKQDAQATKLISHFESIKNILHYMLIELTPYYMALQDEKLRSDKKSDNTMIAKTRFEVFYGQISDAYQTLGMAVLSNHKENSKSESSSNTLALANGEADSASNSSQNKIFEEEGLWARALCFHEKDGPKIAVAPIDVGRIVHEQLLVPSESVVFTSATLANDKGDQGPMGIEWATGHLYLDSSKRFKSGLYLPPVFDYRAKTRVYFCDDMKDIYHENFVTETLKEIIPLIKNIQGGSLLLFSSKKRFEQAREILLQKLEGEIPLFIQGMGQSVVEDFKNSGKGVLLGMEMFGEGIDIPGKALQFLFIDKIPDLRQDLVIQKRRDFFEKKFGHEFTDYFLAHRTRSLHQKLGRLLRTNQDVGTAIVVDSRIKSWKTPTLEKVYKLMSPYEIKREKLAHACLEIRDFLNNFNESEAHPTELKAEDSSLELNSI